MRRWGFEGAFAGFEASFRLLWTAVLHGGQGRVSNFLMLYPRKKQHSPTQTSRFLRFINRPLAQLSSSHRVTLLASCSTNPTRFETISPVTTAPNEHLRTTSSASLTTRFPPIVGHVRW